MTSSSALCIKIASNILCARYQVCSKMHVFVTFKYLNKISMENGNVAKPSGSSQGSLNSFTTANVIPNRVQAVLPQTMGAVLTELKA